MRRSSPVEGEAGDGAAAAGALPGPRREARTVAGRASARRRSGPGGGDRWAARGEEDEGRRRRGETGPRGPAAGSPGRAVGGGRRCHVAALGWAAVAADIVRRRRTRPARGEERGSG